MQNSEISKPWGLYFSKALWGGGGLIYGGEICASKSAGLILSGREIYVSKSIGLAYNWREILCQ